jgi:hypothetical protein
VGTVVLLRLGLRDVEVVRARVVGAVFDDTA